MSENKHVTFRLLHAKQLEGMSPCTRAAVGAVIFNPETYTVIADGYNGSPRGAGPLCGGDACTRTELKIESGTRCEIGCHHAESNALANAASAGASTRGAHMAVTCEPCLMCAKFIHHAQIQRVYCAARGYATAGVDYLRAVGVGVVII
jgi:dCMP deaminase